MQILADTDALVAEGVITPEAAAIMRARARETMVTLAINTLLCGGILFATAGLVVFLADALSVAVLGVLMLAGGLAILSRGAPLYAMFGNASALIGAGMLLGGAALELVDRLPESAGWSLTALGATAALAALRAFTHGALAARFVSGAIALMGLALHLWGIGLTLAESGATGLPVMAASLYAAGLLALAGWRLDLRIVTALAIVPFAQALDTGTAYFHAAYVFYSPEPTLSILQMAALIGAALWVAARRPERDARHAQVLAVLAFIVANLCALVGSLWGDVVGSSIWGPVWSADYADWEAYEAARDAYEARALVIPEQVYSVLWALALAGIVAWAAHALRRGLFNAGVTFAAIHAYTQVFESFYASPLAYVIGGLAAIPLAWGFWRLNRWFVARGGGPAAPTA